MGGRGARSFTNKQNQNSSGGLTQKEKSLNISVMNNRKESAIAYDDKGNVVFRKDGDMDRVKFNREEVEKLEGINLTHNHPTKSHYDSLFSDKDISMAFDNKVSSISTVNQIGEVRKLKRLNTESPKKAGYLSSDYQYEKVAFVRKVSGGDTKKAAVHMDNWLKENAKDYGWEYTITKL